MPPVSASHRGNSGRVPRGRQPVVHGRSDPASLNRRLAPPFMAGDQKHRTVSGVDRPFEAPVDRAPRLVQVETVQIEHPVRLDRARPKPAVPGRIQRPCRRSRSGNGSGRRPGCRRCPGSSRLRRLRRRLGCLRVAGERADRRCDSRPQLLLVRAERAHAPPRLWEAGSAPGRKSPFHRRSDALRRRRPRRCRAGWRP